MSAGRPARPSAEASRAPGAGGAPRAAGRRILFTTSNGTGLGHLTRSMAIARRLDPGCEPLFITLSAAAPVVAGMGFPVEYVASYATPGSGNDYRWSRRLRGRLRAAIAEADPAVIVFDGTHPYEALLGALRADSVAVWCRRPLWKRGSSRVPLGRAGAFDAVLEPGELAEAQDRGPTVAHRDRAHRVEPIVLLDRSELLSRNAAEAALGLEPGRTNVLVSLGQGQEVREATARCLRRLAARDDVQVAALQSAIAAAGEVPEGVVHLRATYPMSRHFAAFDATVAAAGYNAYHELIALGVPALYVPMRRETDDQAARARHAEQSGLGLAVEGPADPRLEEQLDRLLDRERRGAIAARLSEPPMPNGAARAARWLAELAGSPGDGEAADTGLAGVGPISTTTRSKSAQRGSSPSPGSSRHGSWRSFRRRWGQFLASAPRTAVRLVRQQLTQPSARTVIVALGIAEGEGEAADAGSKALAADSGREVAAAVSEALAATDERPDRALVVTDSLAALGALRGLGVGVEHVPSRDSRQAELAGGTYEEFVRARLELIRAERPRARRVLVAPGGAPLP